MEKTAQSQIKILSPEVAGHIAAGEVVDRPASVLKELLENALDAGAGKIQIQVEKAGRKLLRVSDNGSAMTSEDLKLAVLRHATSKISTVEDLESIRSFGFRGEALYSIAAVSRLTISSCPRLSSKEGYSISWEAGKITSEHSAPPVPGTVVEVKDLFFNFPARAKFLKSDASEKGHLLRTAEELAMAHPELSLSFQNDQSPALEWPSLKPEEHLKRLVQVMGKDFLGHLTEVLAERPAGPGAAVKLKAYLSPLGSLTTSRNFQYFWVNKRPIQSRLLQQALYKAYGPHREAYRHPAAFVWMEMPPDQYDVNVHPAKREIRFRSERDIFELLSRSFENALLESKTAAPLNFSPGYWKPQTTSSKPSPQMIREAISLYKTEKTESETGSAGRQAGLEAPAPSRSQAASPELGEAGPAELRYVGQLEKTYLIFEEKGGLTLLDQHAAQERIFFEKLLADSLSGKSGSQPFMIALPVEMPPSMIERLKEYKGLLRRMGFDLEIAGKGAAHLLALPAGVSLDSEEAKKFILELMEELGDPSKSSPETIQEKAAGLACRAAVKAHQGLSPQEALALIKDLRSCKDPSCCPHGRPAALKMSRDQLARQFKRPGAP